MITMARICALGLVFAAGSVTCGLDSPVSPARAQEEMPKEVLAVQVRKQGFSCASALSAQRDPARSKPDEAVWILTCEGATYRMRLVPDMAAAIERID